MIRKVAQQDDEAKTKSPEDEQPPTESLKCGLVMPISGNDLYPAEHWREVKIILVEAVESLSSKGLKFDVKMVSEREEAGVIQKQIVNSLYYSDIVVCDVSGKNPNVMLELGMRLAFDKPVVIVKDDRTDYNFDTQPLEHVPYPRDLRYANILDFKLRLSAKVEATHRNPGASFLKSFGDFVVASLPQKETSPEGLMIEMLRDLQVEVRQLRGANSYQDFNYGAQLRPATSPLPTAPLRIVTTQIMNIVMGSLSGFCLKHGIQRDQLRGNADLRHEFASSLSGHPYFAGWPIDEIARMVGDLA